MLARCAVQQLSLGVKQNRLGSGSALVNGQDRGHACPFLILIFLFVLILVPPSVVRGMQTIRRKRTIKIKNRKSFMSLGRCTLKLRAPSPRAPPSSAHNAGK